MKRIFLLVLLLLFCVTSAFGATVSINTAETHQTIMGFGGNASTDILSKTGGTTALTNLVTDLNLKYVRCAIEIGGITQSASVDAYLTKIRANAASMPVWAYAKALNARGAQPLFTMWAAPSWMMDGSKYLLEASVTDFKNFWTALVLYAIEEGITFTYIELSNEPDGTWDTYMSATRYWQVVSSVSTEWASRGLTKKIAGPGTTFPDNLQGYLNAMPTPTPSAFGIASTHTWTTYADPASFSAFLATAKTTLDARGLKLMSTEYGTKYYGNPDTHYEHGVSPTDDPRYAFYVNSMNHYFLASGIVTSMVIWDLYDMFPGTGGLKSWGVREGEAYSFAARPHNYALQIYYRLIPTGSVRVGTTVSNDPAGEILATSYTYSNQIISVINNKGTGNNIITFSPALQGTYTTWREGNPYALTTGSFSGGTITVPARSTTAVTTGNSYYTTFPLTENPISEGGKWSHGTHTLGGQNIRTTGGNAVGTGDADYNDAVAYLTGYGTWSADQSVQVTVYNPTPSTFNCAYEEVELHLRGSVVAGTPSFNKSYEVTWNTAWDENCGGEPNYYLLIVRWNGNLDGEPGVLYGDLSDNGFTLLVVDVDTKYKVNPGDVLKATIVGQTIYAYKNGILQNSYTDNHANKITSGVPGFGHDGPAEGGQDQYGISDFFAWGTTVDPLATAKTQALLTYLTNLGNLPIGSTNKILSGQYDSEDGMPETVGANASGGKWPALLGKDYHMRKWGRTAQNSEIISWDANKGIATITIWYDNPDGTDLWSGAQAGVSLTQMTTPGGTYNSWLNGKLDADAVLLRELANANVPVILRMFPEMDGTWPWYGNKGGTEFTKLWIYAFNRFTVTNGLHNLLFFYCPDNSSAATYYPGSGYVDIVGFDIYSRGTSMSAEASLYTSYVALNKPFAIGEYGYQTPDAGSFALDIPTGTNPSNPRRDLNSLITSIQTYMPKTVFWMNWDGSPNASFSLKYNNINLDDLFNNSLVATRDEVNYYSATTASISVTMAGTGSGTVTSSPSGITCTTGTCSASFTVPSTVVLTAAVTSGSFTGWSGGTCSGALLTCSVSLSVATSVTATFTAAATADTSATAKTQALLTYMTNLYPNGKVLSGQMEDTSSAPGAANTYALGVYAIAGKYPAIIGREFAWNNMSLAQVQTQANSLVSYANAGGGDVIVRLTSSFSNPLTGGNSWDTTTVDLVQLITPGGIQNGIQINSIFNGYLDKVAAGIQILATANIPVIYGPLHEMTGCPGGFWYQCKDATQYINLYKYVQTYMNTTKGLHNILWLFAPNHYGTPTTHYPGSAYIDIVGLDTYPNTFSDLCGTTMLSYYTMLTALNKPFGLSEFGPCPGSACTPGQDMNAYMVAAMNCMPKLSYWINWDEYWGMMHHNNVATLLDNSKVYTRDEVAYYGVTTPGSTSWGHSVSATEPIKLAFADTWTCSPTGCLISGTGDAEKITLTNTGDYAYTTNCSYVGVNKKITLKQSYYRAGSDVTLKYRTGTSNDTCKASSWINYTTPFWMPTGNTYVGVRLEK